MVMEFIVPIISILAGIFILVFPAALRFIVGGYLVLVGLVSLFLALI
jgi:hypothetical protein